MHDGLVIDDVHARVVEVSSATGGRGSGFAVTPDLVLTAAHVVADGSAVEVVASGGEQFRGAVVWRNATLDAALVRVPVRRWDGIHTRWATLSGTQPVSCTAIGYPRVQKTPDGRRVEEHLAGFIMPATGRRIGRYAINVISSLPYERAGGGSPWSGLSGAAVLTGDGRQVLGVLVDDPTGFEASRLEAVPVAELLNDAGFAGLVGVGQAALVVVIGGPSAGAAVDRVAVAASVAWPLCVGMVPELAAAFQPRRLLRERVEAARNAGADVILADGGRIRRRTGLLAGHGGVGKSQLAAWFAHEAISDPGLDLVVWVPADSAEQVIATYARAGGRVVAPGVTGGDAMADAVAFREWLLSTDRSWLVVLDDVTSPAQLADWWPPSRPNGWTLVTTRLQDATVIGSGRYKIDIDVFAVEESAAYLADRLSEAGRQGLLDGAAPELARELGQLPLALSHAAAFMINEEESCARYLARYRGGRQRLSELMPASIDPDGYGRPVAVTLLLGLDAADALGSDAAASAVDGLARPTLLLASLLDPAGHPEAMWATSAVTGYLSAHRTRSAGTSVSAGQARMAVRRLHRYGLLTHTSSDPTRAVRIHALTARAAREAADDLTAAVRAAADALMELWPVLERDTAYSQALRANAMALRSAADPLLWTVCGGAHELLLQLGRGLGNVGLVDAARAYFDQLHATAVDRLGPDHRLSFIAQHNVARWQGEAGDPAGAARAFERHRDDMLRVFGPDHPYTLTSRHSVAWWRGKSGDAAGAAAAFKALLTDRLRVFGPDHPDTLANRHDGALWLGNAGDPVTATAAFEVLVTDRLRVLGPDHPDTLSSRHTLAWWRGTSGDVAGAVAEFETLLTDRLRILGPDHPATLTARSSLAWWLGRAGDATGAVAAFEALLADRLRVLGPDHPATLATRHCLIHWRGATGEVEGAVAASEVLLVDQLRVLGPGHPDTLVTRFTLAWWRGNAGHVVAATTDLRTLLADRSRLLGADHPDTLATRRAMAQWTARAGDVAGAVAALETVLADCERVLGVAHPDTRAIRDDLVAWRSAAATAAKDDGTAR
ncbi:tetratricopeptide repeat protein [Dactylosporangium sp. NPDC000244]|uniref:tetratricopeptide repeat protein n=1 Tax=Dactylosporangium sp. NPDC000244 TaxID=3154365 RepID=UPI0033250E0F